jgi:hypothetical protein
MSIGLIHCLTPAQRRFVLLDNVVGPFIVNLLINGVIAWLLFRKATHVPMWGQSSIAKRHYRHRLLAPRDHVPDCYATCARTGPDRSRGGSGRRFMAMDSA